MCSCQHGTSSYQQKMRSLLCISSCDNIQMANYWKICSKMKHHMYMSWVHDPLWTWPMGFQPCNNLSYISKISAFCALTTILSFQGISSSEQLHPKCFTFPIMPERFLNINFHVGKGTHSLNQKPFEIWCLYSLLYQKIKQKTHTKQSLNMSRYIQLPWTVVSTTWIPQCVLSSKK